MINQGGGGVEKPSNGTAAVRRGFASSGEGGFGEEEGAG